MAIDGDPAGGLEAAAVADIEMLVAKRLREEHLQHFLRTRDELLRLQRPDDSETIRLLRRRQLHTLKEAWDGVLRALRSELPGALDQLFASLEPEFQERPPSVRVSDAAPSAPAAAVEASVDVSGASLAAKSPIRTRSSRPAPSALNATVAGADGKLGVVGVKEKPALSKSDETPKKRPLDNNLGEQVTTPPSKKAKKGPQVSYSAHPSSQMMKITPPTKISANKSAKATARQGHPLQNPHQEDHVPPGRAAGGMPLQVPRVFGLLHPAVQRAQVPEEARRGRPHRLHVASVRGRGAAGDGPFRGRGTRSWGRGGDLSQVCYSRCVACLFFFFFFFPLLLHTRFCLKAFF